MDDFDELAPAWDDDPAKWERADAAAAAIRAALTLDGSQRLLEYGAGTGLVTQALRRSVGPVTLVDTSAGMRDVIAAKLAAGTLAGPARVWDLDLEVDAVPDETFDVIVTVMTMHHVRRLDVVLAGFAKMLEPGGSLCVVDLDAEDGSFHGEGAEVHHGFDRLEFVAALAAAGLGDVEIVDCHRMVRDDRVYPLFLAVARPLPG